MKRCILPVAAALFHTFEAQAVNLSPDGITISYNQYFSLGSDREADFNHYRAGILWDWRKDLYQSRIFRVDSFFELSTSYIDSQLTQADNPSSDGKDNAIIISFSPVFRLSSKILQPYGLKPFIDVGVGGAWFSEEDLDKKLASPINLGSHLLFEIRVMAGLNFGHNMQYEVNYGWLHYSNGDLATMNEAIDFQGITLGMHW